jgi:hypothetical protein
LGSPLSQQGYYADARYHALFGDASVAIACCMQGLVNVAHAVNQEAHLFSPDGRQERAIPYEWAAVE